MRQSQEIGSLEAASSAALADLYLIRINIVYADLPCFGRAESVSYMYYKGTKNISHYRMY